MEHTLLKLFTETHTLTTGFPEHFRKIAESLMRGHALQLNDEIFEFTDIEFYYQSEIHKDINTHAKPGQTTCGELFFNGYGVDITFGDSAKGIYGGILLRGLRNTRTGAFTCKPMAVLEQVMRSIGSVFTVDKKIGIIAFRGNEEEVVASRRLRLSKEDETNERPYRFLTYLIAEHKFDNKEAVVKEWSKSIPTDSEAKAHRALGYNVRPR